MSKEIKAEIKTLKTEIATAKKAAQEALNSIAAEPTGDGAATVKEQVKAMVTAGKKMAKLQAKLDAASAE